MIIDKLKAYGAIIAAAILGVLLVAQTVRLSSAHKELDKVRLELRTEQRDRAEENRQRTQVALEDARETYRKGEIHTRNQQEIADAHVAQTKRRTAARAPVRSDGERLRNSATTFAAAGGGGEGQSAAAALSDCRNRAATLGILLGEADSQAEEFAGAAEQHADEIRTLKAVVGNDRTLLPEPGTVKSP